jgi:hypothetical protein
MPQDISEELLSQDEVPAQEAEPVAEQADETEETWQQRYKSLEGIYKKQKSEYDALKTVGSGDNELKELIAQTNALIAQQGDDMNALMEHFAMQSQVPRERESYLGEERGEAPQQPPSRLTQRIAERREDSELAKLFADMVRDAGYSPVDPRFRECWKEANPLRAVTKKVAQIAKEETKKAKEDAVSQAQEIAKDELKKYFSRNPQAVKVGKSAPSAGGAGFDDIEAAFAEGRISRDAYKEARERYEID